MNDSFENKVILVTGASSGIGRAVCRALSDKGASVILLARNEDRMKETASMMPEGRHLSLAVDLRDSFALKSIAETTYNWRGRLDGCVYCAGVGGRARLRDASPELMSECMQVNCFAFVELVRSLVKLKKREQAFNVVAISSFAALGRDKYFVAYAASKAALEAAAKTLSVELISRNIRINLIRPAFVNTPMVVGPADPLDDFLVRLEESGYQPLGIIEPEEVAQLAMFLLSSKSVHMNGVVIPINAGVPC